METSIHFANDTLRPTKSTSFQDIGGVVPLRQRSLPHRASVDVSKNIDDDEEDEDAGLRDERDYKKRQV